MYSFSYLEPVCCSVYSSNCCFLTYIQISEEAGQVVWYSYSVVDLYSSKLSKSFPKESEKLLQPRVLRREDNNCKYAIFNGILGQKKDAK